MTEIKLISIPYLDKTYTNVIDFDSISSRESFFNSKQGLNVSSNIKYDSERIFITVNKPISELNLYDYLFYNDISGKRFYYFIDSFEIVTQDNTKIYMTLDVFTTYLFDFEILDSYVERCHVPRWNGDTPIHNLIDENLPISEYIQEGVEDLYKYNNGLLIASTSPLGVIEYLPPSISPGTSGGDWANGKLSKEGFRFIKGFEGFAPYEYQDTGGYWTIAYGVTLHGEPSIYNELKTQQPLTEERAAKTSYDLKNTKYGLPIVEKVKELGCTKQCQFDALCSLAYNSGTGSITSGNELTNAIKLNPNNETTIRPIWESFKTNGGLAGLVARRKEECNMYFGKQFEVRPISKIDTSGNISGTVTENNGDGWLP